MSSLKTAVCTVTLTLAALSPIAPSTVQAHETLEPDGYDVQARVLRPGASRWTWSTVRRFETRDEAEEYQAFLYFLVVMATTVDHRMEIDLVTWDKFLDEIQLPPGYLVDVRFRIVPHYDYSRFLGLPMSSLRTF